jgi:hypothetical protein
MPMKPMSKEDSQAIMQLIQDQLLVIAQEAAARLTFPLKLTATCPMGTVFSASLAYLGAEPVFEQIQSPELATFPVTIVCTGKHSGKITAVMENPTKIERGYVN